MFNPAGMIYQQVDKRIQQGKLISEKKTVGRPKGKGMLVRSNNKEKVDAKQKYNEPLDFVVDAVITLRKEKEAMREKLNADT
tara:strand:- start:1258 stop:1503 length:246 start_codon:yes stop_codon:yes gene_type:complete